MIFFKYSFWQFWSYTLNKDEDEQFYPIKHLLESTIWTKAIGLLSVR